MRWTAFLAVGLLPLLSGCNVFYYAGHNAVNEPLFRSGQIKMMHRLRGVAKAAWREECGRHPAARFTDAYADGYIDGYADHLNNGGPPLPPAAPPPRYRRHPNDFTVEGQQAERDYLAGFQRGAEAAAASGCRQTLLVQLAIPEPRPEQPLTIDCQPAGVVPIPPAVPPMLPPVPPGAVPPPPKVPLPAPAPAAAPESPRPAVIAPPPPTPNTRTVPPRPPVILPAPPAAAPAPQPRPAPAAAPSTRAVPARPPSSPAPPPPVPSPTAAAPEPRPDVVPAAGPPPEPAVMEPPQRSVVPAAWVPFPNHPPAESRADLPREGPRTRKYTPHVFVRRLDPPSGPDHPAGAGDPSEPVGGPKDGPPGGQ